MKGSIAKARVLYVPVEEVGGKGRLLRACKVIIDAYIEAGLVLDRDAHHTLKLHATVMNARHRERLHLCFMPLIFLFCSFMFLKWTLMHSDIPAVPVEFL